MILDVHGKPIRTTTASVSKAQAELTMLRRQIMRAKYDAAQTNTGNELHWANADHLDPHTAASYPVRRKLRSRSRYEIIENNPFLKGIILTIANDFVGTGPNLTITDERISKERRRVIEKRFHEWCKVRRIRQKIWRGRVAKIVDGETFFLAYSNDKKKHPVKLDYYVVEADRISTQTTSWAGQYQLGQTENNEIDGVRFDGYENPTEYFVLKVHPGAGLVFATDARNLGQWVKAKFMVHWFRQDRGWLRGIPETTPSLPLCSVLRRYTMAVLRHAETAADFTAIIHSEGPPNLNAWTDDNGDSIEDDPFSVMPIEAGMITNLPWGYTMDQLNAVPLGVQYDQYVGALLREITRPILVPFNVAMGTSKDSNMASSIVDENTYKGGQKAERIDCDEVVLDSMFALWWEEAARIPGYLGDNFLATDNTFREQPPEHRWRWDRIGLDHTDPSKVANALVALRDAKIITDRDIQEGYNNRSVDEWREEIKEDQKFREEIDPQPEPTEPGSGNQPPNKNGKEPSKNGKETNKQTNKKE